MTSHTMCGKKSLLPSCFPLETCAKRGREPLSDHWQMKRRDGKSIADLGKRSSDNEKRKAGSRESVGASFIHCGEKGEGAVQRVWQPPVPYRVIHPDLEIKRVLRDMDLEGGEKKRGRDFAMTFFFFNMKKISCSRILSLLFNWTQVQQAGHRHLTVVVFTLLLMIPFRTRFF